MPNRETLYLEEIYGAHKNLKFLRDFVEENVFHQVLPCFTMLHQTTEHVDSLYLLVEVHILENKDGRRNKEVLFLKHGITQIRYRT